MPIPVVLTASGPRLMASMPHQKTLAATGPTRSLQPTS
jgi:hypothetical protein